VLSLAALIATAVAATASPATDLRIAVWPEGRDGGDAAVWRLRCSPPGGTLPEAGTACRRLFAMRDAFAPVPKDAVCTQIYGGPQQARVVGTFRGRRIWAGFRRNDGCQIARWNRHAFLFPGGN
jgi:hypothetical protein